MSALLTDKVAIITGASRGIGAATAHTFADAGARLVLAARTPDPLHALAERIRAKGGQAIAVPTDVGDPRQVAELVAQTMAHYGRLDAAVNNAGAAHPMVPLAELSLTDWQTCLQVNLTGIFLCLKHQLPALAASGGGAIVVMSSTAALAAKAGLAGYAAANAGALALTRTAALDYAAAGIRVNALAPGPILTDRLAAAGEQARKQVAATVPLGRPGHPHEVAAAAAWLCSEEASFITGTTLTIDGGRLAGAP